jgi:hypothetical protein
MTIKKAGTKAGKNITPTQYSRLLFLLLLASTCGAAVALLAVLTVKWVVL